MLSRLTLFVALAATALAQAQNSAPQNADWTRPFPPFRMIGNIYWVGSYDLSTYKPNEAFNPERFVDPAGFLAAVQQLEKAYLDQLARERSAK